ncbi:MAG: Ppx/GppA phosphatase family protein [Ghiorsea sp.]|nr:Ppx/GppA phosphatase family protein [Ghiorsea sp.]
MSIHLGKHIAAVDMGTNSFHMIIAKAEAHGAFHIVDRMKHWVRLGDGVDARGYLNEEAIGRMLESLKFFKQLAKSYDAEMHCIATSAMRDAPNRNAISKRIRQELDLVVEIVNGEEEARLVFQGVRSEGYIRDEHAHIIDIGGGSTEVIVGNNPDGVLAAESLDMGARRYSRKFFTAGNYTPHQIKQCHAAAASKIQAVASEYKSFDVHAVYGTSGTIRSLAEVISSFCEHDDATHLALSDLKNIRPKLIAAVQQSNLPASIEAERQATLVAGSIILEEVMRALNIKSLRVCPSALREGIIFDRIASTGRLPSRPIKAASKAMAKRFNLDKTQIKRVTLTAETIFKAYASPLDLNEEAYRLLIAACQLHEIGLTMSHKKIHLHGSYIIGNSNLTGVTQRQQHMLSAMVRFHRKASPHTKHVALKTMRSKDIRVTIALAAILRLAAALNRTKSGEASIPDILEEESRWVWSFATTWFEEHDVCIWNAEQEKRPLFKLLGKPIQLYKNSVETATKD